MRISGTFVVTNRRLPGQDEWQVTSPQNQVHTVQKSGELSPLPAFLPSKYAICDFHSAVTQSAASLASCPPKIQFSTRSETISPLVSVFFL